MIFSNKAIGLEIGQEEIRFALAGGKRHAPRLDAWATRPLSSDVIRLSTKDPNISNPAMFAAAIREAYLLLLTDTKRVSVSLPDAIGRVMLMDMETRFKSRDEARDLIRWKLKKSIPLDVNEIHLDYQVLREKETGEISVLVALVSRQILNQYEDLLVEAGLEPNKVDFSSFNRYRLYSERLELANHSAYLTFFGRALGLFIFNAGNLEFYRTKEIPGKTIDPDRIFREINNSFVVYREKYPAHTVTQVYCSASSEEADVLTAVLSEAVGIEPVVLDVERVVTRKEGLTIDHHSLSSLAAALGAATRNL